MTDSAPASSYASTIEYGDFAARLLACERVALVTHRKPDGDAIGSALALARALSRIGVGADVLLMGPIEPPLRQICAPTPWSNVDDGLPAGEYDAIVVLDTGAWSQLEPLEPWLRERREIVLGIDHHVRGDEVAPLRIVDPASASTTEALVPLIDAMGVEIDLEIAEPLFVGLATDTGWFRYENADADAFRLASRLLDTGVDKARLYQIIEETHRPARLALESRALKSIEYHDDGTVAILALDPGDFDETGATSEDLTGIVNLPMIVATVQVAILLTEIEPGLTKMSFRAKPASRRAPSRDVNELARRFGGGGHVFAAGARLAMPLAEAKARVIRELAHGETRR